MTGTAQSVELRSYQIWEEAGRPDGCDMEHWLQAEAELASLPVKKPRAKKAAAPKAKKPAAAKTKRATKKA